jgi:hypothetical protein
LTSNSQNQNDYLNLSDDELRYLVNSASQDEYPFLLNQLLDIFTKYRIFFITFKMCEMALSLFLILMIWDKRESTISSMQEIYRDLTPHEAYVVFHSIVIFSMVLNIIFYPFGFYAIAVKNIKVLKFYSTCTMFMAVTSVFLIYINL